MTLLQTQQRAKRFKNMWGGCLFCFGFISGNVQGLLLFLHQGLIPSSVQGPYGILEIGLSKANALHAVLWRMLLRVYKDIFRQLLCIQK